MADLPEPHRRAVLALADRLEDVEWALTGSASFALQGVPVEPDDVDVQTGEGGAYEIADRFDARVTDPVSFSTGERIRSHFGALAIEGVRVEVMGDVQRRRADGSWSDPTDVAAHREFRTLDGRPIPVLSLDYEAAAYRAIGRDERAALLAEHADGRGPSTGD